MAVVATRHAARPSPGSDRIVLVGGAANTLDLLRLATVRSDDVVLVMPSIDPAIRRFVERYGVLLRLRQGTERDLIGASAALIAVGNDDFEDDVAAWARALRVPAHVYGRPLESDFTLIDMLERQPASFAVPAAAGDARLRTIA